MKQIANCKQVTGGLTARAATGGQPGAAQAGPALVKGGVKKPPIATLPK